PPRGREPLIESNDFLRLAFQSSREPKAMDPDRRDRGPVLDCQQGRGPPPLVRRNYRRIVSECFTDAYADLAPKTDHSAPAKTDHWDGNGPVPSRRLFHGQATVAKEALSSEGGYPSEHASASSLLLMRLPAAKRTGRRTRSRASLRPSLQRNC